MENQIIWFEIAALLCSLLAIPFTNRQKFLRIYPVLLSAVVIVEGYYTFFVVSNFGGARVYNYQVPFQYICYLLIIYLASSNKKFKVYLLSAIVGIVLFTLITNRYFNPRAYTNIWSYSFCSIFTILAIVFAFYEMLKNPQDYNFLRNPFFYMLFAFLLYNLVTLPYFIMANWQYQNRSYQDIHKILANVMSVMNYVLYSVYSISFIWIILRRGIY